MKRFSPSLSFSATCAWRLLTLPLLCFVLTACGAGDGVRDPRDPYENFNRKIFDVHQDIDGAVVAPAAKGYSKIAEPIRTALRNFFDNLRSTPVFINDVLQGEWERAGTTFARFMINSTIGLGGFLDPASGMGLPDHHEDFGQTLAVYGVKEGPYAFTPGVGPTPPRAFAGSIIDTLLDPVTYLGFGLPWVVGRTVVVGLDARANALETLDEVEKSSVDYYASVRSLYYQNKESEINNGEINLDDLPDWGNE